MNSKIEKRIEENLDSLNDRVLRPPHTRGGR